MKRRKAPGSLPPAGPNPFRRFRVPAAAFDRLRSLPGYQAASARLAAWFARAAAGLKLAVSAFHDPGARRDLRSVAGAANRALSPERLALPRAAWGVPAMLAASASIMALETLLFHLLSIVTDYLTAATVIGLAMFGLSLGGIVSFLFSRWNLLLSTALAAAGLFVSVVFSYSAVIAVNSLDFPWPLILPFFFASFIVSNVYAAGGNANVLSFANSLGALAGVALPLVLVPAVKSETALIVLLLVPCLLLALTALRVRNLLVKAVVLAAAVVLAVTVMEAVTANLALPERFEAGVFEKKILPAAGLHEKKKAPVPEEGGAETEKKTVFANPNWRFMKSVYAKDDAVYRFTGDGADLARVRALLLYLGYGDRFPVPGLTLRAGLSPLPDPTAVPAALFEGELQRAFQLRFTAPDTGASDRAFLERVYARDGDWYRLGGSGYDRRRAKYLLGDLGFFPYYDLNLDVRRHGNLRENSKSYDSNLRVLLSEDDLLGRLEYAGDDKSQLMAMNAVYLDGIDAYNGAHWDPRVPRLDFLKNPAVFIIGLSADGIAKSAKRLEGSTVAGVELHPSVMRTMTEPGQFAALANRPYDGVEAHLGEGRSFLQADPRRWDMITLMNIHPEHGPLNTVAPENLHTVEGVRLLLDRLTDRGMLVYEEIVWNERSELAFMKFLNTCRAALAGADRPERCFYIFRWDFLGEPGCFRTLVLRRVPLSPAEVRGLDVYYQAIAERYPSVALEYAPGRELGTAYERVVLGQAPQSDGLLPRIIGAREFNERALARLDDPRDIEFLLSQYFWNGRVWRLRDPQPGPAERVRLSGLLERTGFPGRTDLSAVSDDRPFPYAVYREKTELLEILNRVLLLALLLCLPIVVLLLRGIGAPGRLILPAIVFTALSGFAYMLVEIILLQRFQIFIGNPSLSLAVVLGAMLFSSGLGSLAGHFLPRRLIGAASALIPALLLVYLAALGPLLEALAGLDGTGKLAASALAIFPVSFLMGMPFPAALETVKRHANPAFTALLYGVSGGCSTVGSAAALYINVTSGFTASFSLGTALYAAAAVFFFLLLLLTCRRPA